MAEKQRRARGEGSITQIRKKGVNGALSSLWMGKVTISPGVRKSIYAPSKDECLRAMRLALANAEKGLPFEDRRVTVSAFLEEWLNGPVRRSARPTTAKGYERYVRLHLVPHLGTKQLSRLQPEHVDAMLDAMAKAGASPQTCHHARTILRTALAWAERNGRVARNVAKLSTAPRVERKELHTLTAEQARALVKAAAEDDWGAMYVLTLDTGIRQGEALGLRWCDVDLDNRTLRVTQTRTATTGEPSFGEPKSASSRRTVAFGTESAKQLTAHRARQLQQRLATEYWHDTGLVFTRDNGLPLAGPTVSRRWKVFLRENSLPEIRFHDLRHASASFLLASGIPARAVADRLGHSSTRLTQDTYGHLAPLRDVAAATMDQVLGTG